MSSNLTKISITYVPTIKWSKVFSASGSGIVSAGSCYSTVQATLKEVEAIVLGTKPPARLGFINAPLSFFNTVRDNKIDPKLPSNCIQWRNKIEKKEVSINDLKSSMPALVPSVLWIGKQDENSAISPKRNLIQDVSNWVHTGMFCIELDLGKHGNISDSERVFNSAKKACEKIAGFVCIWQSLNYGVKALFTADRPELHSDVATERFSAHEATYLCLLSKLQTYNKSLKWDACKDIARLQFLSTERKFYSNENCDMDFSVDDDSFNDVLATIKPKVASTLIDDVEQRELENCLLAFASWAEENGLNTEVVKTLREGFTTSNDYQLTDFCPCCKGHSSNRCSDKDLSVRRDPETGGLIFHCFHSTCQTGVSSKDNKTVVSSMSDLYRSYVSSITSELKMDMAFGLIDAVEEEVVVEEEDVVVVIEEETPKDIELEDKEEQEQLSKNRVEPLPDSSGVVTHVPTKTPAEITQPSKSFNRNPLQIYKKPASGWIDQYKDEKTGKVVIAKTDANIIWFLGNCMALKGVTDLMTKEEYLVNVITGDIIHGSKSDLSYIATLLESFAGWTSSERVTRAVDSLIKVSPTHPFLDSVGDWDGKDHIGDLIKTIHTRKDWSPSLGKDEFLREVMEVWLCATYFRCFNHTYTKDYAKHISNICPILVGAQGIFKNRWVRQLAYAPRMLDERSKLNTGSKDDIALSLSSVIIHIDEVESNTLRTADLAEFKSYLTKTMLQFRQPYDRRAQSSLVQASFIGSTNQDKYLVDESGSRRFYTIPVQSLDIGEEYVDIQQVWAQAKALVHSGRNLFVKKEIELASVEMNIEHSEETIADTLCDYLRFSEDPQELSYRNLDEIYRACWVKHFGADLDIHKITRRERNTFGHCLARKASAGGTASTTRVNVKREGKVLHMYPFTLSDGGRVALE